MWPFREQVEVDLEALEPSFPIGQYCLGDFDSELLHKLVPLSTAELEEIGATVRGAREALCHAPEATYLGLTWEITLALRDGYIERIAATYSGPRPEAGRVYRQLLIACTKNYPVRRANIWQSSMGNILVSNGNRGDVGFVEILQTATSFIQ